MEAKYARAVVHAALEAVTPLLRDYCDVLTPAGSFRRGLGECRDLDLVAVPSQIQQQGDMFGGDQPATRAPLTDRLAELRDARRITFLAPPGHQQDGKLGDRMARFWLTDAHVERRGPLDITHVPIDLYVVLPPATYAVLLAIRTGSATWNAAMMAWLNSQPSGKGYRIRKGALWHAGRCLNNQPDSESDLYERLGLAYATPPQRETSRDFQMVRP